MRMVIRRLQQSLNIILLLAFLALCSVNVEIKANLLEQDRKSTCNHQQTQ